MDHTQIHAVVEISKKGEKVVETVDNTNKVAKGISAWQAFRDYDWLRGVPVKNAAGNLRGMVLSKDWNAAFQFTVRTGEVLEGLGAFAAIAVGMAESAEEIEDILNSKDAASVKAARLSTQLTAISMKYLTGIVTAPTHLLLTSLPTQGYCDIVDLATRKPIGSCQKTLKAMDIAIQSAAQEVSDGNNIYTFVNTTINPAISKAVGF
jgi:hypothetical protein